MPKEENKTCDFLPRSDIEVANVKADYIIETLKSYRQEIDKKLFDDVDPCNWDSFTGQYRQCITFLADHFVEVVLRYVVDEFSKLDDDDYNVLLDYLDSIYQKVHKSDRLRRFIAEAIASFFLDYAPFSLTDESTDNPAENKEETEK